MEATEGEESYLRQTLQCRDVGAASFLPSALDSRAQHRCIYTKTLTCNPPVSFLYNLDAYVYVQERVLQDLSAKLNL